MINFLPIPVLDGGHMVLLLYEGIRGKPADERVQEVLTWIGLIFILALMIFVISLDFGWIARPGRIDADYLNWFSWSSRSFCASMFKRSGKSGNGKSRDRIPVSLQNWYRGPHLFQGISRHRLIA